MTVPNFIHREKKQTGNNSKRKNNERNTTGGGIRYCDECPFLGVLKHKFYCPTHEILFEETENITIPDICGNKQPNQ